MAIYHLSVKAMSRSKGRSATAAAAYRSGIAITDERTGEIHDYTKKKGVLYSELILPNGETADRAEFWNSVENHHKRGDAVLVREVEVALPAELTPEQRKELAVGFARELAERYNVAADVALHAPHTLTSRDLKKNPDQYHEIDPETGKKHNGNWHAHIMLSACHVAQDGTLGKKAVELDPIHCQRAKIENMADRERVRWSELSNAILEKSGHDSRVDHRSLKDQGIDREPTQHLGVTATSYERRTGEKSLRRYDFEREASERLQQEKEAVELDRETRELQKEIQELDRSIIANSADLSAAIAERERNEEAQARIKAEAEQAMKAIFDKRRQQNEQPPAPAKTEQVQAKPAEPAEILKPEPAPTKEQQERCAMLKLGEIETQLRETWRKSEHKKLLEEADIKRLDAWKLKEKEPVKSFFGGEKYKREVAEWRRNLQRIIDEHSELKKKAEDALKGGSFNERTLYSQFERQTRETLKKRHPELDQALTNKAEREHQAREAQRREQERQKQERKQNPRKDHDLER